MQTSNTTARALIALLVAVSAAACQNPVSPGDHASPAGVEIVQGGAVLIRVELASATEPPVVTGQLTVAAGQQSEALAVRFLTSQGGVIPAASGYYLAVTTAAPGVATWQPTTAGAFGGRLSGVAPGTTQLTFELMHGAVGGGHRDGAPIPVPVTVEPAS